MTTLTQDPQARRVGGMNAIAAALGVPRQQVYAWYSRRARNGFPAALRREARGRRGLVFDLAAVERWHEQYVPSRGGRPKLT